MPASTASRPIGLSRGCFTPCPHPPAARRARTASFTARASGGLQTCLKEWAPVVKAIGEGSQTVILRKGGLREPAFRPEDSSFLLFPTAFHTDARLLKPNAQERYKEEIEYDPKQQKRILLDVAAYVTGAWTTEDPAVLEVLSEFHIWGADFLETRLKWRPRQPITVMELRAYRLAEPVELDPATPGLFGCFSWIKGSEPIPNALWRDATPSLDDLPFAEVQLRMRRRLQTITTQQLEVKGRPPAIPRPTMVGLPFLRINGHT